MNIIQQLEQEQVAVVAAKRAVPDFDAGDTVIVNVKVVEGERSRVQAYEGVCIARSGGGINENFTVRKISYGEGVERIFPVYSPMIDSIKVIRRGKVRRAKLYYLRGRTGKSARIAEKRRVLVPGSSEVARLAAEREASAPKVAFDDVSHLPGAGPKVTKALNDAGITSVSQIASMDDATLFALDEKIGMKGRTNREKWIEKSKAILAAHEKSAE